MKKPFLVLFTIAILALFLSNSAMVGAQDDGPMSPDMPDLPDHYHAKITEAAVAILPKEIRKEVNFNVWPSGDYAGSAAVIAGSYEEDHPKEELPYWHHSWDPDLNDYWYSSAVHEVPGSSAGTALDWADYYFNQAIYKYRLDKKTAYFYLGRTAHLLGDMATPAHVHMDAHYPCKDIVGEKAARLCDLHQKIFPDDIPDSDKYEKYLGRLSGEDTLPPMSFATWDYQIHKNVNSV